MGMLSWILLGLAAGLVVKWTMPYRIPGGVAFAVLLGVGGACAGGLLGVIAGIATVQSFDIGSLLTAVAGALSALFACPDAASSEP